MNNVLAESTELQNFLTHLNIDPIHQFINKLPSMTQVDWFEFGKKRYPKYINEYWTAKQRQGASLHEISYRACFKGQLPKFFIKQLSNIGDFVYDPFGGRGTTAIEAGLHNRKVITNDVNPLSKILSEPRFEIPRMAELKERLEIIPMDLSASTELDLSMFYHQKTEAELVSLRHYLINQKETGAEDYIDRWIRMIATNRLTGHSNGFFSVYTLPPNQAVSAKRQIKINEKRQQVPTYREIKSRILKKSKSLLRNLEESSQQQLLEISKTAFFLSENASETSQIKDGSIQLTVTSPPFLDVVHYASDNWLRCWFNDIDTEAVAEKFTMSKSVEKWSKEMQKVFIELFRVTQSGGWVAFEVGEVQGGKTFLDEHVIPLGETAGFACAGVLINLQKFTKTANIWGIKNNAKGTNTNRIVLFFKE